MIVGAGPPAWAADRRGENGDNRGGYWTAGYGRIADAAGLCRRTVRNNSVFDYISPEKNGQSVLSASGASVATQHGPTIDVLTPRRIAPGSVILEQAKPAQSRPARVAFCDFLLPGGGAATVPPGS